MLNRILTSIIAVLLVSAILITGACSKTVHTKQIPPKILDLLETKFMMSDVLAIAKATGDLKGVNSIHVRNSKQLKHVGTQDQGEMRVEGYSMVDPSSPIVGWSFFFHKASDSLANVDTSLNPLDREAMQNATLLIKESLESIATGDNSKLYLLGMYDLDKKTVVKITLREETSSKGPEYAIRYAISSK
jgi:hypothetical protein